MIEAAFVRAKLYCVLCKLLEFGEPVGFKLRLADHMYSFDFRQFCASRVEGLEAMNPTSIPRSVTISPRSRSETAYRT